MSNIVIDFKPTVKQKHIFDLFNDKETTEIIWGGAVGGGKSYALGALMVMKCLQHAGVRIGLARNNITTLKKTTVVSVMEVLSHWGLKPDEHYNYNSQAGIIKFFNESEIVLQELQYVPSDPQYARLGGLLLTFVVIDEVQECDERGKAIFQTRAGRWMNKETGIKPILIGTCNPSKSSFIFRDYYVPYKEGRLKSFQQFVQVLPTDNPHLPEDYISNLERTLTLSERKRLLQGQWELNDDETSLFKYSTLENAYDTSIPLSDDKTMRMSCDIAFTNDKCVFVIWRGLTVVDIIVNNNDNNTVIDTITNLAKKHLVSPTNISFDADGVGKYLRQHFPSAKEIHNNGKTHQNHGYKNLKTELYFKLSELMDKGIVKISTDKYKKEIGEEASVIKHKSKESLENKIELITKALMKRELGRSPDFMDAIAYGMIFQLTHGTMTADSFSFNLI